MWVKCNLLLVGFLSTLGGVIGNGYMIDPPARASMWRVGYDTPIYYDDMSINCGGFYIQHYKNNGLCGLCGDAYDRTRHHETGGKYASGIITRTYKTGGIIPIRVNLTSSHGGWFEFRLCQNNEVTQPETRECFEMNLLQLKGDGKTRFSDVPYGGLANPASILMEYQLPSGILCNHCVLQWIYNTGKDWGCDDQGVCALGLGVQEQFVGCSDIGITVDGEPVDTNNNNNNNGTSGTASSTPNGGRGTTQAGGGTTQTGGGGQKSTTSVQFITTGNGGHLTQSSNAHQDTTRTNVITGSTTVNGQPITTRSGGGDGRESTTALVPQTTTTAVDILECQAIGVLKGRYDQFCRDMCYTASNCSVVFCNDKCHLRAQQLDDCQKKGSCPVTG